jgi:hypothetical protein
MERLRVTLLPLRGLGSKAEVTIRKLSKFSQSEHIFCDHVTALRQSEATDSVIFLPMIPSYRRVNTGHMND